MTDIQAISGGRNTGGSGKVVWSIQVILALLFLFAGGMKLAMPVAVLAHLTGLPGAFMQFIGVAECAGALGLVLPGLLRIQRRLTPLAAVGLVTIMAGAVVATLQTPQPAGAVLPLVVGCLTVYVARRRWDWIAPRSSSAARAAGEPALAPSVHARAAAA